MLICSFFLFRIETTNTFIHSCSSLEIIPDSRPNWVKSVPVLKPCVARFEEKGKEIPAREKREKHPPRRLVMDVGQISKKTYMRREGRVTSTNVI